MAPTSISATAQSLVGEFSGDAVDVSYRLARRVRRPGASRRMLVRPIRLCTVAEAPDRADGMTITQAGRTAVMSEPLRYELKPAGRFYVSANMARMAAGILRQRSTLEPRLTRTLMQMVRQVHADNRPTLRWYAEDIDALLGQALQERKKRLPSVAGFLQFQRVVLAQRVRQWQAGYRGRRCREHYERALRRVAVEVGITIPEVQIVQDTTLHKWVQLGMKTARYWSHARGDGRL